MPELHTAPALSRFAAFFYVVPNLNYKSISTCISPSMAILAELVINLEFGTLT